MFLFCFGLGYVAVRVGRALLADGWSVAGTVRDAAKAERLRAIGLEATAFDGGQLSPEMMRALEPATHILASIPPVDASHDPDPALRALRAVRRQAPLHWAGYLSTTGVYGDAGGGWVDEDTPVAPGHGKAANRVAAETAWTAYHRWSDVPVDIFRLAGIYGPGRSPLDAVRQGRARRIVKPDQVFSRIHVDDIVTAIRACVQRPNGLRTYNLCDDEPAPPQDVIAYACAMLGLDPPAEESFETAEMHDALRTFYSANRRVSSARIKRDHDLTWRHPTYRSGLQALALSDRANQ